MRHVYRSLLIALLAAGLLTACNKPASGGGDATVLATVDGKPITGGMLEAFVHAQTGGSAAQLNDTQRQSAVRILVNMQLLAGEALKNGMANKPEMRDELAVMRNNSLAQAYAQDYMDKHKPAAADIKAAYDQQVKGMDTREFKARHILVENEQQAKDIIAKLHKGADFGALAKQYSKDPGSKNNGGDLGDWTPASRLDPGFVAGMASLKKNGISPQPVKSQFGWHVIQLLDERTQPVPTFDQMQGQIAEVLQRKSFQSYLDQLRTAAKVDMKTPAPATAVPAMPAKP